MSKQFTQLPQNTGVVLADKFPHRDVSAAVDKYATLDDIITGTLLRNMPQGALLNGYISRTVASNNITVAIKTLAGADPSATDPVHVRVGNTVRTVTAALSVTKNAGTNWMNLGAAEHATQDVDLFVYIGYNATDGVTIGFSRIPYARVYGDFSATTTNDKYCAISVITTAASTDEYELVGRFNATLSASASYNWSVPGTSIIISKPISETRWLSWSPTWTGITPGNGVSDCKYQVSYRKVNVRIKFTGGTTSSGTSTPIYTLPLTASSNLNTLTALGNIRYGASAAYPGYCRLSSTTAGDVVMLAVSGATIVDANLPVAMANGYTLLGTINYEPA